MAPVKQKAWEVIPNLHNGYDVSDATGSSKREALLIKNIFIGFTNNPWIVESSSDSVAAGNNDQVDRWIDIGDIVNNFAGSIHSWYVVKDPVSGQQVCFDLAVHPSAPYNAVIVWSPATGFGAVNGGADGTTTARPTATDEIVMVNGANFGSSINGQKAAAIHAWRSTDGECTRIVFMVSGNVRAIWAFETPRSPISAWSPASLALVKQVTSGNASSYALNVTATSWQFRQAGIASGVMYLSTPGSPVLAGQDTVGRFPHGANGELGMWPIGLISKSTSVRGAWGLMYDLYFGPDNALPGSMIRDGSGAQWAYVPDMWLPWNPDIEDMRVS